MIRYLLDENVTPLYQTQILQREPDLVVWAVGDVGAPLKGTLDPDILIWCEEQGFVLVTNNRTSMPPHLADHSAQDRHVPGIFIFLGGSGGYKTKSQVTSRKSQLKRALRADLTQ